MFSAVGCRVSALNSSVAAGDEVNSIGDAPLTLRMSRGLMHSDVTELGPFWAR